AKFSISALKMSVGEGSTKDWTPNTTTASCQIARMPAPISQGIAISRLRRDLLVMSGHPQIGRGALGFAPDLGDLVADGVDDFDEARLERRFDRARARQVHLMGGDYPAWPCAHDEDHVREEGRLT